MSAQKNARPIIIKRKNVVAGDGHHGGAWKVAYADFVTAMMAFFMLMWLLNATTEKQRKGIADYFTPTIPINRISGGGDGAFGGESIFSEETLPKMGTGASNMKPTEANQARGAFAPTEDADKATAEAKAAEDAEFKEMEEALLGRGGESSLLDNTLQHIISEITDEGYKITVFARPGSPLFGPDGQTPTPVLREAMNIIAGTTSVVDNPLAVGSHVAAIPIVRDEVSAWERSSRMATAALDLLHRFGLPTDRTQRVTGYGDSDLLHSQPLNIRNNRIVVTVLRK